MVCLASRPYGGYYRNMGRETFLAPVVWEDEWPVVSPGTGKLEFRYPAPDVGDSSSGAGDSSVAGAPGVSLSAALSPARPSSCGGCAGRTGGCCGTSGRERIPGVRNAADGAITDDAAETGYVCDFDGFDSTSLAHSFNFLRTPRTHWWNLTERPGFLRMRLRPVYLGEQANPCFIGRRQQHMTFTVTAELEFKPDLEDQAAGLALVQSDAFHLRFAVVRKGEALNIRLVRMENGIRSIVAEAELATLEELAGNALRLVLRIEAEEQDLRFLCGLDESRLAVLVENIDARMLSTDVAGGFVGTYAGMFAEGENPSGAATADFDSFSYEGS